MHKKIFGFKFFCLTIAPLFIFAGDITGFWKSINEKTELPESIVAIYEYQGKIYGRIVETFDKEGKPEPVEEALKSLAPGVKGTPPYVGMDIIWELQPEGEKYTGGKILDPEKGKIYHAELWEENGKLIVRGEILVFGRNQTWIKAKEEDFPFGFSKPDLKNLTPSIPEVQKD